MTDPNTPTTGDDARPLPAHRLRSMTFIVRITENERGGLSGVVEHARTGRKERFDRVETISHVIRLLIGGQP